MSLTWWAIALGCGLALGVAQADTITVASTTSTEQSGLFGYLLPQVAKATGLEVRVVAVGTGQALDMGRRGDADALLVHDQVAEEKFVAEGLGLKRMPVMYNDFVLIGPAGDPASIKGHDVVAALRQLAAANAPFISRGDKSGTDAAEKRYWALAQVAGKGRGYQECGCGMGPALNIAASSGAYVLADRGTWLSFRNRANLAVLVEGDKRMFNQYGVIVVNPAKFPHLKTRQAQQFANWLVSPAGQAVIAGYKVNGEQLFFPNGAAH